MISVRDFLDDFNPQDPHCWDFENLPKNWPKSDLDGLTSTEISKFLSLVTQWELLHPYQSRSKEKLTSRSWSDPEGYKYLVQWSNLVLLRYFVRKFTITLIKGEYRRKIQIDDAARSTVRNIEEGYKRSTTAAYLEFISFTQGSLEEVKGDVIELAQDKFLKSRPGSTLKEIGIDLKTFHEKLKETKGYYRNLEENKGDNPPLSSSGNPLKSFSPSYLYRPLEILYPPLNKVRGEDLTVEIFLELIIKTDFLLRKLVESLERKPQK